MNETIIQNFIPRELSQLSSNLSGKHKAWVQSPVCDNVAFGTLSPLHSLSGLYLNGLIHILLGINYLLRILLGLNYLLRSLLSLNYLLCSLLGLKYLLRSPCSFNYLLCKLLGL